jgi:hypothetical protein
MSNLPELAVGLTGKDECSDPELAGNQLAMVGRIAEHQRA